MTTSRINPLQSFFLIIHNVFFHSKQRRGVMLKWGMAFIFVSFSFLSFGQSHEKLVLKTGDTLTVDKLQIGEKKLYFKIDDKNHSIKREEVDAYYYNHTWYDMITGERLYVSTPDNNQTSIMKNPANSQYTPSVNPSSYSTWVKNPYLRKAGINVLVNIAFPAVLGAFILVADNPEFTRLALLGGAFVYVGLNISLGVNLIKASKY